VESITLLHTADLHLGTVFPDLPPSIGSQRRRDLMQTLGEIVEICARHQVNLLLLSGDLWQQEYVTKPLVDFVADQFRRIPSTQVIIAPGQADYYWDGSFYAEYPWPANVHIFSRPQLASIWLPRFNTRLWGACWDGPQAPSLDWSLLDVEDNENTMVVCHGTPDMLSIPKHYLGGENHVYFACGGGHKQHAYATNALAPGSPEPLGFDEPGQHGVMLGKTGSGVFQLEFVPVARRQYITLPFQVSPQETMDDQGQKVMEMLQSLNPDTNLFRLLLMGHHRPGLWDTETLKQKLSPVFFCRLEDGTEPDFDFEKLKAEHARGVVGNFLEDIDQQLQSCDEQQRKKLLRARAYGLSALLSREVALW
jgi:DNA repair protein SbcD/Mre11